MNETFRDHFSTQSVKYAAYRPSYPASMICWMAEQAPGSGICWDAATGSGQVAVLAAQHFDDVYATDASAQQLAHAEPTPGVRYKTERAEHPDLSAGSVDLLTVGAGAHWLDLPSYFDAARRVAAPGALVALFSYGVRVHGNSALQEVIEGYVSNVLAPWWSERLALVDSEYTTLDFPFAEIEMPSFSASSFGDLSALTDLLRTWSAAQVMAAKTGEDPVAPVQAALRKAWLVGGAPDEPRRLEWPIFSRVGHVHGPL